MKKTQPKAPIWPGNRRSISRDLTASLDAIVLLVAMAMGGYLYWLQSKEMRRNAEKSADDIIASVAEILAVPIWNLDYDSARLIGTVYTQDDMVQAIRIYGSRDEVVFSHEKYAGTSADFTRIRSIVFEGRVIGRAEIDFNLVQERKRISEQFMSSSLIIVVAMAVILAFTGLLLRIFLNKPLAILQQGIIKVAQGDFSHSFDGRYHRELLDIVERFRRMSVEIEARERALQSMNRTLQLAEEKYRSIFENAVEGIFQASPEGVLWSANPAMARIFGYDSLDDFRKQVFSLGSRLLVNPEVMVDFYAQVRKNAQVQRFEAEYYRKDGETIWTSLNARAILDEEGQVTYIDGILEDITERKKAEQDLANLNRHLEQLVRERTEDLVAKAKELEEANHRLRELDAMKSAFLSSVSHELRTPLTSILGFSKLLIRDFSKYFLPLAGAQEKTLSKGARILENLSIISLEGERLTRLINDVLDLNKIESGGMGWRDEILDLNEIVNISIQSVKGLFSQNPELALIIEMAPNLPKIMGDSDRMQQVMVNLLNNAVKFTQRGSVTVRTMLENNMIRVEVADTGMGISSRDLNQIFEKFHQTLSDTKEDKPMGTGLGLSICKEIIEHYGGNIWAESSLGRGSCFIFTLPPTCA